MNRTVLITQSNYLPWRGYFESFRQADQVVLLDSVQFTRRDWRNRNKIKTPQGAAWISIAVENKGRFAQSIDETRIADPAWADTHRRAISLAYRRAAHFSTVWPWLDDLLASVAQMPLLTDVNEALLRGICSRLGIATPICRCTDLLPRDVMSGMDPSERLAALAEKVSAARYVSGPAAKAYLDHEPFARRGIEVGWADYSGYPEYQQLWGPFEPAVSIVDLMLNLGEEAPQYLGRGEAS